MRNRLRPRIEGVLIAIVTILGAPEAGWTELADLLGKLGLSAYSRGTNPPEFSGRTTDSRTVSLASLQGKVVLLNFWATWCLECPTRDDFVRATASGFRGTRAQRHRDQCPRGDSRYPPVLQGTRPHVPVCSGFKRRDQRGLRGDRSAHHLPHRPRRTCCSAGRRTEGVGERAGSGAYPNAPG